MASALTRATVSNAGFTYRRRCRGFSKNTASDVCWNNVAQVLRGEESGVSAMVESLVYRAWRQAKHRMHFVWIGCDVRIAHANSSCSQANDEPSRSSEFPSMIQGLEAASSASRLVPEVSENARRGDGSAPCGKQIDSSTMIRYVPLGWNQFLIRFRRTRSLADSIRLSAWHGQIVFDTAVAQDSNLENLHSRLEC